jgi:hypothetical protein
MLRPQNNREKPRRVVGYLEKCWFVFSYPNNQLEIITLKASHVASGFYHEINTAIAIKI